MDISRGRLWLNRLPGRVESLLIKYQRIYLGFVFLLALIGYVLILVFPFLVLVAGENIFNNLINKPGIDWLNTLIWFAVFIISALLCYQYFRFKPSSPLGLTISENNQPEIFKLVEKINAHFKRPVIHRIIITNRYELDIIKVPRWALPVWSRNTLVIGLPLLLCFSPQQFEYLMGRKLGQFSKKHNLITNWLYQLRGIWRQYYLSYGKKKRLDSMVIKWLFFAYSFLYSAASVYVVRRDELNADNYAMELFNHEYIREMMTADAVYRHYLNNTFWPAVKKAGSSIDTPHRKLSLIIHKVICDEKLTILINEVFNTEPDWNSPYPSLQFRLKKIAHDTPYMPEKTDVSAASQYLGKSLNSMIDLMDKLWLKNQ